VFGADPAPDLLVGLAAPDDAAVWRIDEARLLVVTTDFFTPIVDDPYAFGAIAAANALSDLYAMGATPFLALNIAAIPVDLDPAIVREILRGGAEKVKEAGAVIGGGHSVQDREPKYGLVALGMAESASLFTKDRARPGDALVLTKPLGTGVTTTALIRDRGSAEHAAEAIDWMVQLNEPAARLAKELGVRAVTDITGFGLLGHGLEMAEASGLGLSIELGAVPFFSGAREYAELGTFPAGSRDNARYFGDRVRFDEQISIADRMLLFDAQTSGGLLLAVSGSKLDDFLTRAERIHQPAWVIGRAQQGSGIEVRAGG
jgi:selenide,water dikinase